jgi:Protein of unknown function (DUF2800)
VSDNIVILDPQRHGWTSASAAPADQLCPGRHQAQRGIAQKPSDDASGGQAIHDALKNSDASKLTLDQVDVYDSCKAIEAKLVKAVFGEKVTPIAFREQRYWCKIKISASSVGAGVTLEHSGQADVVYRSGPMALVIDYKTLQGDVEDSPKNLQLRDLACLVKGHFVTVDQIATAIIQPLVTHDPEVCMYDNSDLARAEAEMFARVAASNAPGAKRVAGETQCKFCLAKGKCVEYSAWTGGMIPTGNVEPVVKELIFQTAMEAWTPNQRAIAASLLGPAGKALDEIKEFLKDGLAQDPAFVPGWTLSAGTKRESIKDPQACFDRFAGMGGKLDDFMGCVTVGKTRLKEAVNKVTGSVGRKLDADVAKLTEGIVEASVSAPSLKKQEGK